MPDLNYLTNETDRLNNLLDNYEKGIIVVGTESLSITASINPNIQYDDDYDGEKIYHSDGNGKILRVSHYFFILPFRVKFV